MGSWRGNSDVRNLCSPRRAPSAFYLIFKNIYILFSNPPMYQESPHPAPPGSEKNIVPSLGPCIIMIQHQMIVVAEWHSDEPQYLITASLCIQNTTHKMHFACPYHYPTTTRGHPSIRFLLDFTCQSLSQLSSVSRRGTLNCLPAHRSVSQA